MEPSNPSQSAMLAKKPLDPASADDQKLPAPALATSDRPARPQASSELMQPPDPRGASQDGCLLRRVPLLLQHKSARPPRRTLAEIRKGTLETVRVLMPASEAKVMPVSKVTPVATVTPEAPQQRFKPAVLRRPVKSIVLPAQRIVPAGDPVAHAASLNGTACNNSAAPTPASKTRCEKPNVASFDDDGAQTGAGTESRKRTASTDILVAAGEREEVDGSGKVAKKQHKPAIGQSERNAYGGTDVKRVSLEETDSRQVSKAGCDAMAGDNPSPGTDNQTETVQAIMGLDAPLFSGKGDDTADDSQTETIVVKQEPSAVEEGLVPGQDSTVNYVKISFIPVEKLGNYQVANLQGCDEGDPLRIADTDTATEGTASLLPGDLRSSASLGVGIVKRILCEATTEAVEEEDSKVRMAMIEDSDTASLKHSKDIKFPRQEAVGQTPSQTSARRRRKTGSDAAKTAGAASEKAEHTETGTRSKRRASHPATCKQCDCATHCPSATRRNAQLRNSRRRKASQALVGRAETGRKGAAKAKRSTSKAESNAPRRREKEAVPTVPLEHRSVHEAAAMLESEQELLQAAREAAATEADRLATARATLHSDTQALMKLHTQLPREWTALTRLRRTLQEREAALESSRRAFEEQRQRLGLAAGATPHQKRPRGANPSLQPTIASYWSLHNPGSVVVGEDAEVSSSSFADTETGPIIIVIPPASER